MAKQIEKKIDKSTAKIFIAGPMRGYKNYNFGKFDAVEKALADNGFNVVNPAKISQKFKEDEVNSDINVYNEMVRQQQEAEKTCNTILLLNDWQWSKGTQLEVKTAVEAGMQFILEHDLFDIIGLGAFNAKKSV